MDQWERASRFKLREWKKGRERPKSNVCRSSKKWQVNDKDNREYEFSKY